MKKFYALLLFTLSTLFINAQSLEWGRQLGGVTNDYGNSIAVDSSGNVFSTGQFTGTADFDPGMSIFNITSAGSDDIFISKLDASGNFIWAKKLGGTSVDIANSIAVDAKGNVYTMGFFYGTADFDPGPGTFNFTSPNGLTDIFISKLDSSGKFIWAKQISGPYGNVGLSIAVDLSGNVYSTGKFASTTDFDPGTGTYNLTSAGSWDIFISKLDSAGNFIWAKRLGGTDYDEGRSIAIDPANSGGNVYTTGFFNGTVDFNPGAGTFNLFGAGDNDVFISKLDSSGNFVWAKPLGGPSSDFGNSIKVDQSGNVYTIGCFNGTADFNPSAGTLNLTAIGGKDVFISKLDALGNFIWAKQLCGSSDENGNSITIDGSGNVYATGVFSDIADFDPSSTGTFNLTSDGGADIFISNLDASGNFLWAKQLGGVFDDYGNSIAIVGNRNVYIAGCFQNTANFDPGASNFNLTSAGGIDVFVAKFLNCGSVPIPICLVTVDSLSQNNIIVWNKPITTSIDSFIVYRDTANNNYARIGAVSYDSLSQFIDTVRTLYLANGDPNASSWRYKLAVLDTCGTLSALSPYHQTLFMINNGGTFIWTHYQIEGQNIPVPGLTNYIFQRDNNSTGNYSNVISLSASSTLYYDPQFANYPQASYRVMTQWSTQCTATKSSVDYNSSRSNVKGIVAPNSIKEISLENISIFPNPNDGTFTILLSNSITQSLNPSIIIYNVLGKEVHRTTLNSKHQTLNLKLLPGIYQLKLKTDLINVSKKIIIE